MADSRCSDRPGVGRNTPYDRPSNAPRCSASTRLGDLWNSQWRGCGLSDLWNSEWGALGPSGDSENSHRGGHTVWIGDYVPDRCEICNREEDHEITHCPYLVLASQLDVFKKRPSDCLRYRYYLKNGLNEHEGIHGRGEAFYDQPSSRDAKRSAADAMRLQKDGMNMVRISNLPKDSRDPEQLYRQFEKIGPVAHVIVFHDQGIGFVNFVCEQSARRAIKDFNCSHHGHLMWATLSPD